MGRPEKENKFNRQLSSLMDSMLKNGVRIKSAAEVGKRAVQFTRGDEILKWVVNNKELAYSKCSLYFENAKLEDDADVANFVDTLIENGFMYRAQYQPLEGALEKSESGSIKRPVWPKRLIKTQKQRFDTLGFYIISYEGSQKWNYLKLSGILFGVLALCMFKAWPLYLKLSMWYISVVLLTFLIVAIVLRLILFLIMWFGGYDFWLFPNLFDEDLGVVDSFKPLYSLTYRKDNLMMIACRVLCAVLIAVSAYQLGKTHDISDIYMFTKQSFLDVLDWGHQKLIAEPEDTSFYKSIGADLSTEFTEKVSETAEEVDDDDYNCLFKCGFKSLEDLITNCMKNCDCMSNLLENDCLKDCPQETINSLTEAKLDVCKREICDSWNFHVCHLDSPGKALNCGRKQIKCLTVMKLAILDYVTSVKGNRVYLNVLKNENIKEVKEKLLLQVKNNLENKDSKSKIKRTNTITISVS